MLGASQSQHCHCHSAVKSCVLKSGPGLWGTVLSLSSFDSTAELERFTCERRLGLVTASLLCFLLLFFVCSVLSQFISEKELSSRIEFSCLKLFVTHSYWNNTSTYWCCKQHFLYLAEICELTCFIGTCYAYNKIHLHLEQRDMASLNTGILFVNSYSLSRSKELLFALACYLVSMA